MRCSAASTLSAALRPCVPHGLRALTPPARRSILHLRDGRGLIAVDSTRDEAYVRNISLVPHGTPSTSSDVERFGMTLERLVPTASSFRSFDQVALAMTTRDRCAEHTFRARCQVQRVRSRTQVPPIHRHHERHESPIDVQHGQAYHGRTRTQARQTSSTSSANRSSRRDRADGGAR